jgi:hypothetical protein
MADPGLAWPEEEIPDKDRLFMRIHRGLVRQLLREDDPPEYIPPGVFRDQGGAMSTDWEKYSTAEETRLRGRTPTANGVISIPVGPTRSDAGQVVKHTPDLELRNRAHTDVTGEKDPEVRMRLRRIAGWEIRLPGA